MEYRKRRRYLVNKKLQLGLFLRWSIVPLVLIGAILYYFKAGLPVLIFSIFAVILFCWHMLVLSHRVAGPIYRLEKDLADIAKGNFSIRIKFRKKDELKSIAEAINKILDEMEQRITK
ncbi:HAMP domain-containing protein [Candidatus Omnitrophota bacterium]